MQTERKGWEPTNVADHNVYTDGSKTPAAAGGGWAIIDNQGDLTMAASHPMGKTTNNHKAELRAITQAANTMATEPSIQYPCSIAFHVDSQSALESLANPWTRTQTVFDCKTALNNLSLKGPVWLQWVRAHVGHDGNEAADQMAKQALTRLGRSSSSSQKKIQRQIKAVIFETWQSEWLACEKYRQCRIFFPVSDTSKSNFLLSLPRQDLGYCVRSLTGHNFTKYHEGIVDNLPRKELQCD